MILGITCAMQYLRRSEVRQAAKVLFEAADGYRGFVRLCRKEEVSEYPQLLRDFEDWCSRVLRAFEPPFDPGKNPVKTLVRVARRLPRRRRRARPDRITDALDALITAGRAGPDVEINRRVLRDLARMLHGRVLFHREEGTYLFERPQDEHTLSTWTLHRLLQVERLRRFRVRPRPEFWRPNQHRPRALMVFPLSRGLACIARRSRFTAREARAVRAVLRFLEARRGGEMGRPQKRLPDAGPAHAAPLAGEGLIGTSRAWRAVLEQVARVAAASCSVVLLGETGTGKGRLAKAIHSTSARSQGPFVPVNCGAVPEELMPSELFGHIRGAFTGADRSREGLILRAHRGTLFLDEVADMSPSMQVALLRVLEEGEIKPVGSVRARAVDVRIVCATNKDLQEEVTAGRFRRDLYHRLNVIGIRLPPLRERAGDLHLLAEHLLAKADADLRLHPDALAVLHEYGWPGNVRELDNVLRAAALLVDGPEVTPEILRRLLVGRGPRSASVRPASLGPRAEALLHALGDRWLSAPALAGRIGVSPRTVNRELRRLLAKGLVQAHGEARARTYRRSGLA